MEQKGVKVVLLFSLIAAFGALLVTHYLKQPKPPTPVPDQQDSFVKRIIYTKEDKLFSSTPDGKDPIDLSALGIEASDIIVNKDGEKLYFVKQHNIFFANSDGSQIEQITNNSPIDLSYEFKYKINLLGVNNDGSKLLFSYEVPFGGEKNPDVRYGTCFYDLSSDTVKFVRESVFERDEQYRFVQFVGDVPIYAQYPDDYLYALDPNNNRLTKFSKVPLPGIGSSNDASINTEKGVAVYTSTRSSPGAETTETSYGQIVSLDYRSGNRTAISPAGTFAEYHVSGVSPNFESVIYGHKIRDGPVVRKTDFYHYDYKTGQTKLLAMGSDLLFPQLWLNDEEFLYASRYVSKNEPATIYKVDLRLGDRTAVLKNITWLVTP